MPLPRKGDLFAGRYEILDLLGVGGMGSVHLVLDRQTDSQAALKVMGERAVREPALLQRFQREIETLRRIDHPDILHYLDHGRQDGAPFLVFDLVTGRGLAEAAPDFLGHAESVLMLGARLARAFAAAHAKGVVHRDIKPENIKFTEAGEPRILDYGLARWITPQGVDPEQMTTVENMTATNVVMGTVPYMSPEQLRGQRVDHRTDVFSLAAVLYELAAGRRPYMGSTTGELLESIEAADPPRLEAVLPGSATPALSALDAILRRALLPQPSARFQTMDELARALEQARQAGSALPRDASFAILLPPTIIDAAYEQGAFFGREREMAELRGLLARAHADEGRLVVLEGAAGHGRSRLAGEIAREAHREGFLCLTACPASRRATEPRGLHPEAGWLHRAEEVFPGDAEVRRARAAYDAWIAGSSPSIGAGERHVRSGGSSSESAPGESAPGESAPGEDAPGDGVDAVPSPVGEVPGATRLRDARNLLQDALASLAARMPLLLVAEDLDETDAPTVRRLDSLRSFMRDRPILLLTTLKTDRVRDDPFEAALEAALDPAGDTPLVRIPVGPLGPSELSAIAADLYPGLELPDLASPAATHTVVAERFWERCGGSPSHAREVLRGLEERGALVQSVVGWTLEAPVDLPFPESASARIASRIAGLVDADLSVLSAAAVAGGTFTVEELRAILETESVGGAPADPLERLRSMSRRRRLVLPGLGESWQFEPPIAREALLRRLAPDRRVALESAAARAAVARIESSGAGHPALAAAAAHHFLEAGLEEQALPYAMRAGLELRLAGDDKQALGWLERARAILERRIETQDVAVREALRVQLAEIELGLGESCRALSSNDDALAHFEKARSLAAAAGRDDLQARSLNAAARIYVVRGDVLQAQRRGRDAERLARRADLAEQLALALSAQAHALSRAGETGEAEAMWTEASSILDRLGATEEAAEVEFRLGNHHLRLDRWGLAEGHYARAAGLIDARTSPLLVASIQNARAAALILRRRPAQALPMLEEAVAIFRTSGARREVARSLHNIAECRLVMGDLAAARRIYEQVLADRTEMGEVALRAGDLRNLGEILFDLGEIEGALAHTSEALAIKRQIEDRGYIPHCLTLLGEIELELGRTERARSAFLEVLSDFPHTREQAIRAQCGLGMVEWMAGQMEAAEKRFGDLHAQLDGNAQDAEGMLAERHRLLRFFRERGATAGRLAAMAPPAFDDTELEEIPETMLYRDLIAAELAEVGAVEERSRRLASALAIAERLGMAERAWRIEADLALLAPEGSAERAEHRSAAARIIERQASRFRTQELRRAYLDHRVRAQALRLAAGPAAP